MLVKFPFSKELKTLLNILNCNSELADNSRIIGGCVRDFISGRTINDIDIACKLKPEEVIEILQKNKIKVIETGFKHGTVTAIINSKSFEITTLRKDVKNYGRKAKVEFIDNYFEDAKRRDFTINALSIRFDGKLFDYFNGQEDLKNKKVKFIGNPLHRIKEDYLRILRFFRFSCYFSSDFDQNTLHQIIKLKHNLKTISKDRIRNELIKIIDFKNRIQVIKTLKIMKSNNIFQEIGLYQDLDLAFLDNILKFKIRSNFLIKFCAFVYSKKDKILEICQNFNFSNKDKKYIVEVLKLSSQINIELEDVSFYKKLLDFDKKVIADALMINFIINFNKNDIEYFNKVFLRLSHLELPIFPLNGNDLIESNIEPKNIGKILRKLKELWIESNFTLDTKKLLIDL